MDPSEYTKLAEVESRHWFYRGKRDLVRFWIKRLKGDLNDRLVLDLGAGTGLLISELNHKGARAYGIDCAQDSLKMACRRNPHQMVCGSLERLPVRSAAFDVVTALDVLEHIQQDGETFHEIARVVRPQGLILMQVPAFRFLWSDWDVSLHHVRRYRRNELVALANSCGLETVYCSYTNTLLFPAILVYRLLRRWFPFLKENRLEDRVPPAWLNHLLHAIFVVPATRSWFHSPFGVSLFAVFRKLA